MKLTAVKSVSIVLLALFYSSIAQSDSDNMSVYAQYTSPPNCGAFCHAERERQKAMDWARGSSEYGLRVNAQSQESVLIALLASGAICFGVYHLVKKKLQK